jgi:hypothetical protein
MYKVLNIYFIVVLNIGIFIPIKVFSQSIELPQSSDQLSHCLDRLDVLSSQGVSTGLKPLKAQEIVGLAECLDSLQPSFLSPQDQQDVNYILRSGNEYSSKPFSVANQNKLFQNKLLNSFYTDATDFWKLDNRNIKLRINPLLNFQYGVGANETKLFINQRGVELRGSIDNKIHFYTNIIETQLHFPDYVEQRYLKTKGVLGFSFIRRYNSDVFKIKNGFDFNNAQGHIAFNISKHIDINFGHGRNFIGNGYRSLLLSDASTNYLYLKINTKIWKFNYQNIFAELQGGIDSTTNAAVPVLIKKYIAAHYLNYAIKPNLTFGLFEAVVYSRNNFLELQYLNPLIFYRAVEYNLNSADNVLIGTTLKWNIAHRFSLYGQILLDEFVFSEAILKRRGWWGDKYGIQAGLKYINVFGIDHLDIQTEYNMVRPYTYSHYDGRGNYANYAQPLAHPLGANFKEIILKLRYQPTHRWIVDTRVISSVVGEDKNNINYGSNITLPNLTHKKEYGNDLLQGNQKNILLANVTGSYQFAYNMFFDINWFYRTSKTTDNEQTKASYIGGGIRMNLNNVRMDY